jgi:hypothetical protein
MKKSLDAINKRIDELSENFYLSQWFGDRRFGGAAFWSFSLLYSH